MDGSHLDEISRKLACAKTRRGVLKAIFGAAAVVAPIGAVIHSDSSVTAQEPEDATPVPEPTTTTVPTTTTAVVTTIAPTTTKRLPTTTKAPTTTTKKPTTTAAPPPTSTTTKKPTTTTKQPVTTTAAPARPTIAIAAPVITCGPAANQISGTVSVSNPQSLAVIQLQFMSQVGLAQVVQIPLSPAQTDYAFTFDIPSWIGWVSGWVAVQVTTGWSSAWGVNQPIFTGFQQPSNHIDVGWQYGTGSATICSL